MSWGPAKKPDRKVTGGRWRPPDTLLPPDDTPGWWVRSPMPASFSGQGVLALQTKQMYPIGGDLQGDGSLAGQVSQKYALLTDLGGEGTLLPQVMQREFRSADFNGNGYIVFDTVTIIPDLNDGLTAKMYERYPAQAGFTGEGQLASAIRGYVTIAAQLSGAGALSAELKPIYALTVALAGGGTLSAQATEGMHRIANFLGSGQLTATAFQRYLRDVGVSGAGTLTAFLNERYPQLASHGGEGTMAVSIMQRYFVRMGFGDSFNRADDFAQIGNDWATRYGTMGVYANTAVPIAAATWNEATAPVVMNHNDMEVSFTLGTFIGTPATGDYTAILLGCNEAGEGMFIFFNGAAGVTIYTQTGWGAAGLVAQASIGITQADGDKWTCRRVGSLYTILKNGQPIGLSWNDTGNVVPRDYAHRGVGLAAYTADAVNARPMEDFTAIDAGSLNGVGVLSANIFKKEFRSAGSSGNGVLAATVGYPAVAEVTTPITAVGAYTYTIPWWARYVDEILLGAGGGGAGGSGATSATGNGALAGTYTSRTLTRGVDIPWSVTQLTGNIGDGGSPGSQNNAGVVGGAVTRNAISGGDIARQGNGGGGGAGTGGDPGRAAGNHVLNGKTYVGGTQVSSGGNPGAAGSPPGGGGGGGQGGIFNTGKAGGKGGRGQAWFRAYQ